jgi:hypothetical protein
MLHATYLQMTVTVETCCENKYNKEYSSANKKGTMHVCIFVNKQKGMSQLKMPSCYIAMLPTFGVDYLR